MQAFEIVGFTPVLTENLTNGDCFLSAIYRSLNSRGLLASVAGCLSLKHGSEAEFIQEARNLIAKQVLTGDAREMWEAYMETFFREIETLELQIESAPAYLQRFIAKKIEEVKASTEHFEANPNLPPVFVDFYTYDEFAREIANYIRTPTTWVGQLEVTIFRDLLKLCNVVTDVYSSSMPKTNLPKKVGDTFYIYLYNAGEVHWKHFILQDPGTQVTLSRNTTPGITNSRWRGGKRRHGARKTRGKRRVQRQRKSRTRKV
jgi:hypothetical protein